MFTEEKESRVAGPHSHARVQFDMPSRHARIKVLKPEQTPDIVDVLPVVDPISHDPEVFLVHELLHISMADLDWATKPVDEELHDVAEERHIINVSKALVTLDRSVRNP